MSMIKKTWVAGLVSLAVAGAVPAGAAEVTADTVVATVGGKDITVGHMIAARGTLPPQYQQIDPATLWTGLLDQLVQQTALAQSLDGAVTKATQLAIDNQTSGLLAGEALGKQLEGVVTEESIAAAYQKRYTEGDPETEFHAAHILVETEDEAKAIKEALDGGADFAELAKEKSTGPSGPNGGDLGWFGAGMMVPEFEAAVVALQPGQISAPVQTQFGWHVILLNETRKADAPPLDEVRAELASELQTEAVDAAIKEVMAKTEVEMPQTEIDPAVLNDQALIAN